MDRVREKLGKVVGFFKKKIGMPLETLMKYGFEVFLKNYMKSYKHELSALYGDGIENIVFDERKLNNLLVDKECDAVQIVSANVERAALKIEWSNIEDRRPLLVLDKITIQLALNLQQHQKRDLGKQDEEYGNIENQLKSCWQKASQSNEQGEVNISEQMESFKGIFIKMLHGLKIHAKDIKIILQIDPQIGVQLNITELIHENKPQRDEQNVLLQKDNIFKRFDLKMHGISLYLIDNIQPRQPSQSLEVSSQNCIMCCSHQYQFSAQVNSLVPKQQLRVSQHSGLLSAVFPPIEFMLNHHQFAALGTIIAILNNLIQPSENCNGKTGNNSPIQLIEQKHDEDQDNHNRAPLDKERKQRFYSFDYFEEQKNAVSLNSGRNFEEVLSEEEVGSCEGFESEEEQQQQQQQIDKFKGTLSVKNSENTSVNTKQVSEQDDYEQKLTDASIDDDDEIARVDSKAESEDVSMHLVFESIHIYLLKEFSESSQSSRIWRFGQIDNQINPFLTGPSLFQINIHKGSIKLYNNQINHQYDQHTSNHSNHEPSNEPASSQASIKNTSLHNKPHRSIQASFRKLVVLDVNNIVSLSKSQIGQTTTAREIKDNHCCASQILILTPNPCLKRYSFMKTFKNNSTLHRNMVPFSSNMPSTKTTTGFNFLASQLKRSILIEAQYLYISVDILTLQQISYFLENTLASKQFYNQSSESFQSSAAPQIFRKIRISLEKVSAHYSILNRGLQLQQETDKTQQMSTLSCCNCQTEDTTQRVWKDLSIFGQSECLKMLITEETNQTSKKEIWMSGETEINLYFKEIKQKQGFFRISPDRTLAADPFFSFETTESTLSYPEQQSAEGSNKDTKNFSSNQGNIIFFPQDQFFIVNVDETPNIALTAQDSKQKSFNNNEQSNIKKSSSSAASDQLKPKINQKSLLILSIPIARMEFTKDPLDSLTILAEALYEDIQAYWIQQNIPLKGNSNINIPKEDHRSLEICLFINKLSLYYLTDRYNTNNIGCELSGFECDWHRDQEQLFTLSVYDMLVLESNDKKPSFGEVNHHSKYQVAHPKTPQKHKTHFSQEIVLYKQAVYNSQVNKQFVVRKQPICVQIHRILSRHNIAEKLNLSCYSTQRTIMIPKIIDSRKTSTVYDKGEHILNIQYDYRKNQLEVAVFAAILRLTDFKLGYIDELVFLYELIFQERFKKTKPSQSQHNSFFVSYTMANCAVDVFQCYNNAYLQKNKDHSKNNEQLKINKENDNQTQNNNNINQINQDLIYSDSRLVLLLPYCSLKARFTTSKQEQHQQQTQGLQEKQMLLNQHSLWNLIDIEAKATQIQAYYLHYNNIVTKQATQLLLLDSHRSLTLDPTHCILSSMNFVHLFSLHSLAVHCELNNIQSTVLISSAGLNVMLCKDTMNSLVEFLKLLEFNFGILCQQKARLDKLRMDYENDKFNGSSVFWDNSCFTSQIQEQPSNIYKNGTLKMDEKSNSLGNISKNEQSHQNSVQEFKIELEKCDTKEEQQQQQIKMKQTQHYCRQMILRRKRKLKVQDCEDTAIVGECDYFNKEELQKREAAKLEGMRVCLNLVMNDFFVYLIDGLDFNNDERSMKSAGSPDPSSPERQQQSKIIKVSQTQQQSNSCNILNLIQNDYIPAEKMVSLHRAQSQKKRKSISSRNAMSRMIFSMKSADMKVLDYLGATSKRVIEMNFDLLEIKQDSNNQLNSILLIKNTSQQQQSHSFTFEIEVTSETQQTKSIKGAIKIQPIYISLQKIPLEFIIRFFNIQKSNFEGEKKNNSICNKEQLLNNQIKKEWEVMEDVDSYEKDMIYEEQRYDNKIKEDEDYDDSELMLSVSDKLNMQKNEKNGNGRKNTNDNTEQLYLSNEGKVHAYKILKEPSHDDDQEIIEVIKNTNHNENISQAIFLKLMTTENGNVEELEENGNQKDKNNQCDIDIDNLSIHDGSDKSDSLDDISFSSEVSETKNNAENIDDARTQITIERLEISEISIFLSIDNSDNENGAQEQHNSTLMSLITDFSTQSQNPAEDQRITICLPGLLIRRKTFQNANRVMEIALRTYKKEIFLRSENSQEINSKLIGLKRKSYQIQSLLSCMFNPHKDKTTSEDILNQENGSVLEQLSSFVSSIFSAKQLQNVLFQL